ncbi:hypothetical protein BSKO_12960 [Bryopsis sp. KO-2023]|nr:hypothetical protein BSKO_12960 [Bryopsis sp. KO-2023]
MKFGKQLAQLEESFPAPWRGTMLKYAPLKDRIKKCSHPESETCKKDDCDHGFFRELEDEVDRINRLFETIASATLQANRSLSPPGGCPCFPFLGKKKIKLSNGMTMEATPEMVAQYSRLCIDYARANAIALRKIIKKHDKHCHSRKGKDLLVKLWTDQTGRFSFLHSPLLIELAAVEITALESREGPVEVATPCNRTGSDLSSTPTPTPCVEASTPQADKSYMKIEDLRCPICLDIPFKPISLACSHIFCEDCLFKSCGKGRTLGTTRAILNTISHGAQCPECRQTDVFAKSVILSETTKMLQARHPDYWAERAAEVERYQQELRQIYEKKKENAMRGLRGFHPSYLIYS